MMETQVHLPSTVDQPLKPCNPCLPGLVKVVLMLEVSDGMPVTLGCQGAAVVTCKISTPEYHIDSKHFVGSCVVFVPKRTKSAEALEMECAEVQPEIKQVPNDRKSAKNVEAVTKPKYIRYRSSPRKEGASSVESSVQSEQVDCTNEEEDDDDDDDKQDDGDTEEPSPATKTEVKDCDEVRKPPSPLKNPRFLRIARPVQTSQHTKSLGHFVRYSRDVGKRKSLRRLIHEKYKGWYVYQPEANSWMCTKCNDIRPSETAMKSHVHHSHFERDATNEDTDTSASKISHSAGLRHCKAIRSMQKFRTITCDVCNHVMKSSCMSVCRDLLKTHKVTQHGIDSGESHPCPECSKVCKTLLLLRQHKKGVHRNPTIQCPVDGCESVMKKSRLNYHKKLVHSGRVETHVCHLCGREFRSPTGLKTHINKTRAHGAERKHICQWSGCGKAFLTSKHLKIHERLHTQEMPYQCEMCGFRARQTTSLMYHRKKHHPEYNEQVDLQTTGVTEPVKMVDIREVVPAADMHMLMAETPVVPDITF